MSTLLHFVLSPENVVRLGPQNLEEVQQLRLKNTEYLFGTSTEEEHLYRSFVSLGIYNEERQLAGVLCLNCYPNIPALPPWEWDHYLYNKYRIETCDSMSTLWIHYAVWDRRYTTLFLKPLLQNLFLTWEVLQTVYMACPPGITRLDFIDGVSERIVPEGVSNPQRMQSLFVAKKSDFVAHYTIRRAVEEDNDDLVDIIPKELAEKYGPYYIAELLGNKESQRELIVAEHHGCAVGVLCLNEEVNYDLLNEEFELVAYNGLKKHDLADEVIKIIASPVQLPTAEESTECLSTITVDEENKEEADAENADEENQSEDDFSLVNLSSTIIFNFLYEDDEDSDHNIHQSNSDLSIESHFSAVVLNEEYEDHVYNADRVEMPFGDDRRCRRRDTRAERQEPSDIPTFHGQPNAFAIEICTAIPEHEHCLYLLFQAAFEVFPDKDYIVVSFPTDTTSYYLKKHFARVVPRANSVFKYELYVLHRSTIMGQMKARVSISEDRKILGEMASQLAKPAFLDELFRDAVENRNTFFRAYTFLCDRQIIGGAILSEEDQHAFLELNYDIDSWIDKSQTNLGTLGNIEFFLISPIFQRHVNFFMRELHRMSNFHTIFYKLKWHDYMYNFRNMILNNALSNIIPIRPNPPMEYSEDVLKEFAIPPIVQKQHAPFSLYMSTMRISSMPRIEVNHKLVVIGAGVTTISFLESLIFGKNPNNLVTFTNVTVVSPHGISYHKQPSAIREMVFVRDGYLERKYIDSICLKTYVHVVTGVMSSINRKEKYVGINDDSSIPYDYLFLLCGEQFQKPTTKKKEVVQIKTEFPQNVFIINTEADAANAFNALRQLRLTAKQGNMVVFGHFLEALCCLAALLEFGVSGSNLIYVDPTHDHVTKHERHEHLTHFFNNSAVEIAVLDELVAQGVTLYQDFNFVEWHLDSTKTLITSARFESKYKFVDLELSALFIYYAKGVSTRTFQAIARSGLVFNGRLVIDMDYQTNDPYIYGAGPLTMYSRKYYSDHLMHKYYNSQEVGHRLAQAIRKKLIPQEYWDPPEQPPRFRKPLVQHCRFPGNLHYLKVGKAGPPVPLDVALIKSNYGRVLTTGDCSSLKEKGYFRLHINQFQVVETITCLAKFELNVHNLISLWGKHEILLNHLLLRFDLGMIHDLFRYFDQPWATALYHQKFSQVLDNIFQTLWNTKTDEGVCLVEEIQKKLQENDYNALNKMQMDEMEEICRDAKVTPLIEKYVLDFIHDNYIYLPMYAHQLLVRWILHEVKTSPLFVKTLFYPSAGGEVTGYNPFYSKASKGGPNKGIKQIKRYHRSQ